MFLVLFVFQEKRSLHHLLHNNTSNCSQYQCFYIAVTQKLLFDKEEVKIWGSDPLNPDTDGDGISDGQAVCRGIHPVTGKNMLDLQAAIRNL